METTVTTKNMVSVPQAIAKALGIRPGWKLDWQLGDKPDQIVLRAIPDRAEMARRMYGKGRDLAPGRDAVSELIAEREAEDEDLA
jgi:bifunctional DNA-binding transcriptional regulator/antitoxin component of YhaV-PrlF toxin-antitoxin module